MNKKYSEKYDAYYDPNTGEWLDDVCDDPECEYCVGRPENAKEEMDMVSRKESEDE
jgi:hypothetical protein